MMWMVCDIQVQTLKIIFVVDKIRLGLDNCNRLTQGKEEMNLEEMKIHLLKSYIMFHLGDKNHQRLIMSY